MHDLQRYLSLKNQITSLRQELCFLLETEPIDSLEVLKMSEKLDKLITEFSHLKIKLTLASE